MIPILYESNETDFSHHGIGDLIDCTECTVTEERNGIFESLLSYPVTGQFYSEISVDRIVKVKANEVSNPQAFRIYRISKPINGIVKVYLQHISYDLNSNIVSPFTVSNVNATTALNEVLNKTYYGHHFTATSTLSTTNKFDVKVPVSARKCLGGMDGSILDNFGGEYEFDNFTIKLHANRGEDNGVRIAYGKNLTDITAETAIDNTYTSVYPYAVDSDGNTYTLEEKVIEINTILNLGEPKTLALDLSDKFEGTEITEEKIREYANNYITTNKLAEIKQNIEVSFVQLWQSKEYETLALLERIKMCDIVTIDYPALGVSAKAKVIKTEYDSLKEKFIKITLGEAKSNFANTLNKINSDIKTMQDFVKNQPSIMQQAISYATQMITGGLGGYVVITPNGETGYPEEILIMDKPDKETAINVWRFNKNGLGHSHNGYNGPFEDIALTADGRINASMITTGVFNADLIRTGTINADLITAGILQGIKIIATQGSVAGWKIENGVLVSSDGTFCIDSLSNRIMVNDADGNPLMHISKWGITYIRGDKEIGSIGITKGIESETYGITFNLKDGDGMTWSVYDSTNNAYKNIFRYDANDDNFVFRRDIAGGNLVEGITTNGFTPVTGEFWAIKSMTTDPEGKITQLTTGVVKVVNGLIVAW